MAQGKKRPPLSFADLIREPRLGLPNLDARVKPEHDKLCVIVKAETVRTSVPRFSCKNVDNNLLT